MNIDLERIQSKYPNHKFEIFTDCLFCDNKAIIQELSFMNVEEEMLEKLIEVGVAKTEAVQKGFGYIPKPATKHLD